MVFTSAFKLYLLSMKFFDRASSSSGFDGGLVTRMSSSGSTIPRPKKCAQYRLATVLAKNGFFASVIQSASFTRGSSSPISIGSPSSGLNAAGLPVRLLFSVPLVREKITCTRLSLLFGFVDGGRYSLRPTREKNAARLQ